MIEKHAALSAKIEYTDLDWDEAARVGLTDAEANVLTYFADIEGQTVFYLSELLKLKSAHDPDSLAFATIWNYEEYYHSVAIMKLLDVCGHGLERDRLSKVRTSAKLQARVEDAVQVVLAKLFPKAFHALWMAWGASQELLTLRGYEQIIRSTKNPVLKTLCTRIAKQERRHFAWYFNTAKNLLAKSKFSRRFVRFIFDRFWTPVGGGVKSSAEIAAMVRDLFPGTTLATVAENIDHKFAELPGMEGFDVMTRYCDDLVAKLPAAPVPADDRLLEAANDNAGRQIRLVESL
jgi:rubrerythrin